MIVLDASVLVALLDSRDSQHAQARALLTAHIAEDFALSVLTLAEVLVGPTATGRAGAVLAAVDDLHVAVLPLLPDAAPRLAELRAPTRLTLPDCCVLLAALDVRGRIATFDERLGRAATTAGVAILT